MKGTCLFWDHVNFLKINLTVKLLQFLIDNVLQVLSDKQPYHPHTRVTTPWGTGEWEVGRLPYSSG